MMSNEQHDIRDRVVVSEDTDGRRYTLVLDGHVIGFTEFRDRGEQRIFFHTEIDDAYAGHGLSSVLVTAALDDVRARGRRVVPVCPLVAKFLTKHDAYQDITDAVTPDILAYLRN